MEGIYQIMSGEKHIGTLWVTEQGPYTLFQADCDMRPEVIRLSIRGGGKEFCLGVPVPEQGRLKLCKRLSAAAMRDFPERIERVGILGETVSALDEKPQEADAQQEEDGTGDSRQDNIWYSSPDGALLGSHMGRTMVALPQGDSRLPKNVPGRSRIIDGKEYLVYITNEMDAQEAIDKERQSIL